MKTCCMMTGMARHYCLEPVSPRQGQSCIVTTVLSQPNNNSSVDLVFDLMMDNLSICKAYPLTYEPEGFNIEGDLGYDLNR